ncbi:MAG: amino acid ABC transporter permease [Firmicutes bacterium]|nr:amino acid ABC transporter permease [Bacillota bacterium]
MTVVVQWENLRFLLRGLGVTLELSLLVILISFLLGVLLGVIRYARVPVLAPAATAYVEAMRNSPMLLLILAAHFALRLTAWSSGIAGMSLYTSAVLAEVVRGGLSSIDRGQWEAARSQGFGYTQILWHVVLPQALRRMIPPIVSQFITVVKDTAYVWMIGVDELTGRAKIIMGAHADAVLALFFAIAVFYFAVNYILSVAARSLERRYWVRSF